MIWFFFFFTWNSNWACFLYFGERFQSWRKQKCDCYYQGWVPPLLQSLLFGSCAHLFHFLLKFCRFVLTTEQTMIIMWFKNNNKFHCFSFKSKRRRGEVFFRTPSTFLWCPSRALMHTAELWCACICMILLMFHHCSDNLPSQWSQAAAQN